MRKAARTLSFTVALATLLGACQAVPTGSQGFETLGRKSSPRPTAPKQPARPKPQPAKPSPVTERPKPSQPKKPAQPKPRRDQPRPYPGVAPTPYPGDWSDRERWQRERDYERARQAVRITRVWTEDVGSDQLTVHWTTDRATVGMVQWGTDDFTDGSEWETTPDTYHAVTVSDLIPDTEYRFRVMARVAGGVGVWSPELRERTEP